MDILVKPGSHVQWDWYKSHEGREVIMSIMHRNLHQRKVFGLLERPSFPPHLAPEEYRFKIFVCGKSGVGKTSTISKLSGNEVPSIHSETPGIQTTEVYWPVKILHEDKVVMFQLQFWDAGENALKKFDHVLPACKDQADAVMFVFSFVDKSGFEDLPQQMSRVIEPQDNICRFIMGTKYDLHAHSEITQRDIRDFEQQWRTPVLRIKNITDYRQTELRGDLNEVAPILNTICEHLWHREQILQGRYSIPVEV
ncbi:REM2- and Rab-like small GTPase 1 [Lingula anatina]|uniref:Ciliogenesis and planar polarity effector 2 n=1 Tax=Lingula anatina TaxID=7574 RepID=A0A1S3IID5_LINAN|nr:REM2- and Rab-like small GTPase 1 [Lingula anatina]|eukprot:XP_013397888.1 REM2- and Rab-like small GTPase 1 [Lingula anatina]